MMMDSKVVQEMMKIFLVQVEISRRLPLDPKQEVAQFWGRL